MGFFYPDDEIYENRPICSHCERNEDDKEWLEFVVKPLIDMYKNDEFDYDTYEQTILDICKYFCFSTQKTGSKDHVTHA